MKRIVCLSVLFSVASAWCAFSGSVLAVVEPAGHGSDDDASTAAGDKRSGRPVDILRGQVREHLRAGRIEAALASAQQSLARLKVRDSPEWHCRLCGKELHRFLLQ